MRLKVTTLFNQLFWAKTLIFSSIYSKNPFIKPNHAMTKNKKLFIKESYAIVEYDLDQNFLITSWIGFQNPNSIIATGKEILKIFKDLDCSKVLNDNSKVTGPWNKAAEWVKEEYFPKMIEYGMKQFAWVMSTSVFADLSAKQAMMDTDVIKTFQIYEQAEAWLRTGK